MRIIGGSFKGKKLIQPYDFKTRPLKDLTKESIFNILIHTKKFNINLNSSVVLDIFSGVGSFGIECISRGVKKVIFIENYKGVLPLLKKNLINLKSVKNYKIIEKNIYIDNVFLRLDLRFDVIFIDPPFKDNKLENIFSEIHKNKVLNKNGIIIIHRHKDEIDINPLNYKLIEEKVYGISKIKFFSDLN